MAGERVHVLWSPNSHEEFATYSSQLNIYSFQGKDGASESNETRGLELSDRHYGQLLACIPNSQCSASHNTVAWQQNKGNTHCFAIGESNGRVSLISVQLQDPSINSQNYQLSTRTLGRTCHTIKWNPEHSKLLAQGLEKTRTDSSLIVWDATRASPSSGDRRPSSGSTFPKGDAHIPSDESGKFFETGNGESTVAVSWLPGQPNCLVAGMGSTYIKLFDIRDSQSSKEPKAFAQNKAIYGLAVDPSNPHQIASFAKSSSIYMWDIRSFRNPVYSFQRPGNVLQLEWIPSRPSCLSVLLSEAPYLRIIDIPQVSDATEEYLCHHFNDRLPLASKLESTKKSVTCVEWHPQWSNTGLYVNNEGVVKEVTISDKIPVTWSSHGPLTYVVGGDMFSVKEDSEAAVIQNDDIASQMLARVGCGYGFDVSNNVRMLNEDTSLHQAWSWIKEQMMAPDFDRTKKVGGVSAVLDSLTRDTPSTHGRVLLQHPTYTSPQRTAALRLCGWSFAIDNNMEEFVTREAMNDRYERAAAVAVFQGDIKLAISSLKEGAQAKKHGTGYDLNLIALSLSGYSTEHSLWQDTCTSIKRQIRHPYLRAIFSFLCAIAVPEELNMVLNDGAVSLKDRVALGCMYLNDITLKNYIARETQSVVTKGEMEGLFLTGLSENGIHLLENYVNKTGDVQSACLIAGQIPGIVKGNPTVKAWFDGYRDLLDQWQLWKERALFDHERNLRDHTHRSPRQVALLCTFCSKAISSDILRQDITNKGKKSTSCPSCRKPLPRCALCLLHMVAGTSKGKEQGSCNSSDQFGQWFTWCQTCRHGGHATHVTEWFKSHEVCPVTDCTCHCMSLDCLI